MNHLIFDGRIDKLYDDGTVLVEGPDYYIFASCSNYRYLGVGDRVLVREEHLEYENLSFECFQEPSKVEIIHLY